MSLGNLFIVSAPSGAGKTSLVRALLEADSQVRLSVSYTTRPPRPGEVDGRDYHFVSQEQFMEMLGNGDFLESAEVYGNRYGSSQRWITEVMETGQHILLELDWQGASQVRRMFPQAISIFILPPSLEALRQRLKGRGQDSEEIIARRLAAAREDVSHVGEFDYVIINNEFNAARQDLQAIVRTQRLTIDKQLVRYSDLLGKLK